VRAASSCILSSVGRAVVVLGAVVVVGCSALTSLDGYTGGGGTAADAGPVDAAGTVVSDAGRDAPGPATGFCSTFAKPPRLCVDFSGGVLVAPGSASSFDDTFQKLGGQPPVLDPALFATAAPSARFVIPGGGASQLSRSFPDDSPSVLEFGMSMRVASGAEANDLMEIRLGKPNDWKAALFARRLPDGMLQLWEVYALTDGGSAAPRWTLSTMMPADTWTRMVWRVDANGKIAVTVDGSLALEAQLEEPAIPSAGITFVAGYTDTTKDSTVWVDDVYADF